jgi:hypothetical protein
MQRSLIITAAVIVLLGIGVGTYFLFFNNAPSVSVTLTDGTTLPVAGQGTPPSTTTTGTTGTSTPSTSITAPVAVSSRLIQISKGPIVPGAVVVDSRAASATSSADVAVSYIERESGNVFSYSTRTRTLTRTNNRTVPGLQSALWLPNGSLAFTRYLSGADFSTINTYALPANGTGGFFLSQNLNDIAVSAAGILTLSSGVNGSSASLLRPDGTRPTTIFSTPLSSLRVSFAGKQYLATTKASATLPGNAFLVNSSGDFSRVAGPHDGLAALASPLGKWVLVSYILNAAMQMELVNIATGEALSLPVATIADKCVWAADDSAVYCGIPVNPPAGAAYPDDWYQGAIHFSDRIWKIQVSGRYAQLVLDFPKETKGSLDVVSPAINPANTLLVFINKNDGSLWGYSL